MLMSWKPVMKIIKRLLPFALLLSFVVISYGINQSSPSSQKRGKRPNVALTVEVQQINEQDFQVIIDSYGKLTPKTQGQLTAQVSGIIVSVSDKFFEGGFFNTGDILISIDRRDYDIQVEAADAELAQTKVAFDEEIALSNQAIKDRKNLGSSNRASDFALRKPQMAAAKAKMQAANAKLKKALLDVERTQIRAPYTGRIQSKLVDLGQMVNTNTNIAQIYATDLAQIKLPIKNSQLGLIELPNNRSSSNKKPEPQSVTLSNQLGGAVQLWSATLFATSGAIDQMSQQVHLLAKIEQPFSDPTKRPLNVGQFMTAQIKGKLFNNAIVIPNTAIYQGSYVYVVENDTLQRRNITIRYQNERQSLIASGLQPQQQLVITALGQVHSGTKVKVNN